MSRRYAAAVLAAALLAVLAGPSHAATIARFAADTAGDLVIEPVDDPLVTTVTPGNKPVVVFQRMRAGKTITGVTLGDFGLADGCVEAKAHLTLRHHANAHPLEWSSPADEGVVAAGVPIPATPERMTWKFDYPVLLKQGHTYSLDMAVSGCATVKQRTWRKEGRVEGTTDRPNRREDLCVLAPGTRRLWHKTGEDDWSATCAPNPSDYSWWRSLPTGWLAWNQHIQQPVTSYSSTDCDTSIGRLAATTVFSWTPTGFYRSFSHCKFDQFLPPGETGPESWYYGWPWPQERNEQPRDIYVELDTIDYDALINRYVPYYKFDASENFYPQKVEAFAEFWHPNGAAAGANRLVDGNDHPLATAGATEGQVLTAGMLGANYWFSPSYQPASTSDDLIDAWGSDENEYAGASTYMEQLGHGRTVYGRAIEGSDGTLWLQYYLFYYYNSFQVAGIGVHEGDWEMVQVGVTPTTGQPTKMTFATHNHGIACNWNEVETAGGYPVGYVAARSHATYPKAGTTGLAGGLGEDTHLGNGLAMSLPMRGIMHGDPHWTTWRGRWGSSREGWSNAPSPANVSQQHRRWWEPSEFHQEAADHQAHQATMNPDIYKHPC